MPLTTELTADDFLASLIGLERPARYLGSELGANPNNRPDASGRLLTIALAFPDIYEIAHGHLGHKILYHMLNSTPGFRAERAYAPWTDLAGRLSETGAPLRSLESRAPLGAFDVLGFSLQYEMAYTTILDMLRLSKVPLLAKDRDLSHPIVCAGGPGASNPEPLADYLDLVFLGDAEASFLSDLELIKEWKSEKAPKPELFRRLAGRPGVYIPSLFRPVYQGGRLIAVEPFGSSQKKVIRAVAKKLSGAPFPPCQIVPLVKPVHDRVVVEIGRGCSRGCRFCQAGYIYRPARERTASEIMDLAERNLAATGHDQAAFLSLSAGDHTQVGPLVEAFMDRFADQSVALSLPSLRVRSLSEHLARQIRRVRKTGFTMAPEAGTERLRAAINKDLTESDIFEAAEKAFSLGWRSLKLYFMAGLPTETDEDLYAIASLSKRLGRLYKARLNIGLAHFTPKSHTPFQWGPAASLETIEARLAKVRGAAKDRSLTVRYNDPGVSMIEGVLSRGDRRLGPLIAEVSASGGRLEAWNDHFRLDRWLSSIKSLNLDLDSLLRGFAPGDPLPWSHLSFGLDEEFLAQELERSLAAQPTPDCRLAGCQGCGACHDGAAIDLAVPDFWSRPRSLASESLANESLASESLASESLSSQNPPESSLENSPENSDLSLASAPNPPSSSGVPTERSPGGHGLASQEPSVQALYGPLADNGHNLPSNPQKPLSGQARAASEASEKESHSAGKDRGPKDRGPKGRRGPKVHANPEEGREAADLGPGHRYLARFAKEGPLVLLGHLEMVEVFKRAFRRASIPLRMSRGFHPQPRLVFMTALPVGLASLDECLYFELNESLPPQILGQSLILPEGLRIIAVKRLPSPGPKPKVVAARFEVESAEPALAGPPLHPGALLSYTGAKGPPKEYLLSKFVKEAAPAGPGKIHLTILVDPDGTPKLNPVVRALWGLPDDWTGKARKIATILDTDPLRP